MAVYAVWTDDDKKHLKEYYIKYGVKQAAEMLGRTHAATREQIKRLGYNDPSIIKTWKYDELEYLKRVYPKYGPQRVANRLGRTYKAVQSKANKLGIHHWDRSRRFPTWTDYQLNYLMKNFANMTNERIARNIKKTPSAVRDTAQRLGLKKNKPHIWTSEEEEQLRKMIKGFKIKTISRTLNKPRETIINKMRELNLKNSVYNDDKFKPSEVAEMLGISAQTVRNYCAQNNRVSDYVQFHGKKHYRMTVPQVLRFMIDKIDLWINKDCDFSYMGLLFLDLYSSYYCREEIFTIKRKVEEVRGYTQWPEHIRMTGARTDKKGEDEFIDEDEFYINEESYENEDGSDFLDDLLDYCKDFYLDYEVESVI